ncbi:MAG TPA: hypothetical protein VN873_17840 [Candidatus Angelobacter sp.]|nr:hypothetical protein [Candidatus Angelobacter sp.]
MKISSRQFWLLAFAQACLVAAGFAWRFYAGTKEYLAHPTDGDLYAHHWSFQAVVFAFFKVPLFLVVVGVLIGLERLVWRCFQEAGTELGHHQPKIALEPTPAVA